MNILLFIMLMALPAAYYYVGQYREDDGRLPAASTAEGRKIRLILVPALILAIVALVIVYDQSSASTRLPILAILVVALAAPLYGYFKSRK